MHLPAMIMSMLIPAVTFLALAWAALLLLKVQGSAAAKGMLAGFALAGLAKLAMMLIAYLARGEYPGLIWDIANYGSVLAALIGSLCAITLSKAISRRAG